MNRVHSWIKLLSTWCVGLLCALAFGQAGAVSGAISTTTNLAVDGAAGQCLNGKNGVDPTDCNIYSGKQYVWLSGLPISAALGNGTYFFAVVVPGGQGNNSTANPNDCTDKNLSDTCVAPYLAGATNADGSVIPTGVPYTQREFTIAGGMITSFTGAAANWDQPNNKIRLIPYDDTTNPGGVYILAVCSLAKTDPSFGTPGVNPSDCKYDAFKVQEGNIQPEEFAKPPTVTKDANGDYDKTFGWTLAKSADKTIVKQIGGTVTFTYTVTAKPDSGTISDVEVSGTISVFNPNVDGSNNTLAVNIDSITDQLSDGTVCIVTDGGAQTLTLAKTTTPYTCSLSALPSATLSNTVTVSWSDQFLSDGSFLAAGTATFTFQSITFAETDVDKCITVTDPNAATSSNPTGTLGQACVGGNLTFTYSITVSVPQFGCQSYNNTATFTGNDTGTPGSSNTVTVTVCGPANTGALTIGFWKGPNGNSLIANFCGGVAGTSLASYLSHLGTGSGPFADAAGKTCSQLVTYVNNILNGASATNMNNMLKAQMLGTALDVYFSGTSLGYSTTAAGSGKTQIKPPSAFLLKTNLGAFVMDTTSVCPMVDSLSTGTATCKNNTPSTNGFTALGMPAAAMAVQAILDYAATVPPFNGVTGSGSAWYGTNRTQEEVLKNIFDQINNNLAFAP